MLSAVRACALLVSISVCGVSATVGWSNGTFGDGSMGGVGLATTSLGNSAYFGGAYSSRTGEPVQTVLAYNGLTHQWTNFSTALNPPRAYVGAGVAGRKVIFAGGVDAGDGVTSGADILDVDTGVWTHVPNVLNTARTVQFACSNGAKTKALFWGGRTGGGLMAQTPDVYDGVSWTPVTLPPNYIARSFATLIQSGGMAGSDVCVIAGGRSDADSSPMFTADIYTFSTGVLRSNVTGLVYPREYAATASYGNRVLWAGGSSIPASVFLDSIEYYDAGTDSWGILPVALSVARWYIASVTTPDGGLVFFAGGASSSSYVSVVDMYNVSSGVMSFSRSIPVNVYGMTAAVAGTQVVAAGGYLLGEYYYPYTNAYESSYCAGITPCANGGSCVSGLTGYSCACTGGYTGPTCSVSPTGGVSTAASGIATGAGTGGSTAGVPGTGAVTGISAATPVAATVLTVAVVIASAIGLCL